jgi:hypothetical protein
MRTVGPAVTRAGAIGSAVAAVGVIAFTAYVNSGTGPQQVRAAPTRPVSPVPVSTLPGSVDPPADGTKTPRVTARQKRLWLRNLTGTWTRDGKHTYFRFHRDGSGEWIAFGQNLWTGKATPRTATTFDLSDPDGHGGDYWQIRLLRGRRLLFAGTRQTFSKPQPKTQRKTQRKTTTRPTARSGTQP